MEMLLPGVGGKGKSLRFRTRCGRGLTATTLWAVAVFQGLTGAVGALTRLVIIFCVCIALLPPLFLSRTVREVQLRCHIRKWLCDFLLMAYVTVVYSQLFVLH